uniref:Rab-GAP TBC domain-containing protein n=1 Tax=Panagrellus redivivus TaxID=6233 RepID=A0A7E4V2N1_PANRE
MDPDAPLWNPDIDDAEAPPEGVVPGTLVDADSIIATLQLLNFAAESGSFPTDDSHYKSILAKRMEILLNMMEIAEVRAFIAQSQELETIVSVSLNDSNHGIMIHVFAVWARLTLEETIVLHENLLELGLGLLADFDIPTIKAAFRLFCLAVKRGFALDFVKVDCFLGFLEVVLTTCLNNEVLQHVWDFLDSLPVDLKLEVIPVLSKLTFDQIQAFEPAFIHSYLSIFRDTDALLPLEVARTLVTDDDAFDDLQKRSLSQTDSVEPTLSQHLGTSSIQPANMH